MCEFTRRLQTSLYARDQREIECKGDVRGQAVAMRVSKKAYTTLYAEEKGQEITPETNDTINDSSYGLVDDTSETNTYRALIRRTDPSITNSQCWTRSSSVATFARQREREEHLT